VHVTEMAEVRLIAFERPKIRGIAHDVERQFLGEHDVVHGFTASIRRAYPRVVNPPSRWIRSCNECSRSR